MKKYIPHIVAVSIFLLITIVYFYPVFDGKMVNQSDNKNYWGMSKEINDYRSATGNEALWTNSMFGGMPAFQISTRWSGNLLHYIDKIFTLGLPSIAGLFFLYFIGFFFLLLVLDVNPWLSIGGAIAFALSSFFLIIIEVGHNSQAHAIGYMAPVFAAFILTLRGKHLLGGALTALFLSLELNTNHPQITYYLLLIILFFTAGEFIYSIIEKTYAKFFKAVIVLAIASFIAILPNIGSLWATYQYGKYTVRGKSELTFNKENKTSGLDKDYATAWSYGVGESFSLLIPNIKGGVSQHILNNDIALKKIPDQEKETLSKLRISQYWGDQPGTSGPVYVGAIIFFLFVSGMFLVKGRLKWVLLCLTILSIMLGWGKNFMPLSDFFLDHVPYYNKFRAVSMTLVIAEFTFPLMAFLALNEILKNPAIVKQKKKKFLISLSLTGGLCFIFYLLPSTFFDFINSYDTAEINNNFQNNSEQANNLLANIQLARISIFQADVLRTLVFIILSVVALWLYSLKVLTKPLFITIMILLIFIDLFSVDQRYLNKNNFVERSEVLIPFQQSKADELILRDQSPDYRVLNLNSDLTQDAETSYFHKSVGGYHGAKLKRYQELIEYRLDKEMYLFKKAISDKPTELSVMNALKSMTALNMLNTKYIIYNPDAEPIQNPFALGNAWFVNNYKLVDNADQEITALNSLDPANSAVVDKGFISLLNNFSAPAKDSVSSVKLVEYKPNYLLYKYSSPENQMVVFSEIYYDKGWNAFIDGKPTAYFRADYVLRAMIVPQGEHKIEFKFEPKVYYVGNKISLAGSIILILSLIGIVLYEIKIQMSKPKTVVAPAKPLNTNVKKIVNRK